MNSNYIQLLEHPNRPGYFLTENALALETKINNIYSKLEFLEHQPSWPTGFCFLVLKPTTSFAKESLAQENSNISLNEAYRLSCLQALLADYNLEVDYLPQVRWERPEVTGELGRKLPGLAVQATGDYVIYGAESLRTLAETEILSQVLLVLPEVALTPTFVIWAGQVLGLSSLLDQQHI